MKNLYILALIIMFFSTFGCSISNKNNARADYPAQKTENLTTEFVPENNLNCILPPLLLNNFNQIENGMSYEEVVKIIGSDGIETRRLNLENTELRAFKWKGENYQRIYVDFRNNKVTSKSQAGIK